jgi:hypothetical protein
LVDPDLSGRRDNARGNHDDRAARQEESADIHGVLPDAEAGIVRQTLRTREGRLLFAGESEERGSAKPIFASALVAARGSRGSERDPSIDRLAGQISTLIATTPNAALPPSLSDSSPTNKFRWLSVLVSLNSLMAPLTEGFFRRNFI